MCIYPRKQQALAVSTTHRLMPEVQFVVGQTDLLIMNLINPGEASRCFSQTVSFILLSHVLFLWKVACPYRVRHTFCLRKICPSKHPCPWIWIFSGRGGRSLSDSIFTETFVSLCSLLSDFPLPVRIIDPEIGEPLSRSGTDV